MRFAGIFTSAIISLSWGGEMRECEGPRGPTLPLSEGGELNSLWETTLGFPE